MTLTIPAERLGNIALNERDALVDIAIGLYKRDEVWGKFNFTIDLGIQSVTPSGAPGMRLG